MMWGGPAWGMPGGGCGKGAWKGAYTPEAYYSSAQDMITNPSSGSWGREAFVAGLTESLAEMLGPVADSMAEPIPNFVNKILPKIKKVSDKFFADERVKKTGKSVDAKALVEEYVESLMSTISGACYDQPWFAQVSWTPSLLICVMYTFGDAKVFTRTLKPQLVRYIEDGVFKWQEEERIQKAMWDTVTIAGIKEGNYQKKANKHLTGAFDDAHFNAPYGSTTGPTPEVSVLQDFVKGWMQDFLGRSWDVFQNGLVDTSRESQVATLTGLFQTLLDPQVACMPYEIAAEITNAGGSLPAAPWPFIEEVAAEIFIEFEGGGSSKRRKGAGGKGMMM